MANNKNNINDSGLRKLCSFITLAANQGNIIDDLNIATDKTSSSKHIKDLIDNMSAEDRKYVDDIVANLNKLSSKTTNVVPDASNVEANTLYLYNADLSTATSFEQYMVLSDKTILPLGNTNISLVDYMKTSDADNKYLKKIDSHSHTNKSALDNITEELINNINNLKVEVDGTSYTQDMDGKITLPNYPVPRTDDEIKTLADGQIASSKRVLQFNDLKGITADSTLDEVARAVQGGKVAILQSANFTDYLGLPSQMYTITISSLGYNRVQIIATGKYYAHDTYIGGCNNASGVDVYDKWIKVTNTNDIVTTIDSSSTDNKIPTAKAVEARVNNKLKTAALLFSTDDLGISIEFNKEYTLEKNMYDYTIYDGQINWNQTSMARRSWYDNDWDILTLTTNTTSDTLYNIYTIRLLINHSNGKIIKFLTSKYISFDLSNGAFSTANIVNGINIFGLK